MMTTVIFVKKKKKMMMMSAKSTIQDTWAGTPVFQDGGMIMADFLVVKIKN